MRALMLSLSKFVVKVSFKVLIQFCVWVYRLYVDAVYCMQDAGKLNHSKTPLLYLSQTHTRHESSKNEKNNAEEWGHFIDTETMQVVSIEVK